MDTETLTPPAILAAARQLQPQIVAWRRHLHEHPELSFEEHETTAFIEQQLGELGLTIDRSHGPTGLTADLHVAGACHTIALRADIDALPIHEDRSAPVRSRRPGVMHACGHDAHTAMLLATVHLLTEHRQHLRRHVRFIFQPGEEMPPGGAKTMIAAGRLDEVDEIYGVHVFSHVPSGQIGLKAGPMLASVDSVTVSIIGRGGHGAYPHQNIDPVVAAAHVITALQTIVSRAVDPLQAAVVSVCSIHGGDAFNVLPDAVSLRGTVRTFDDQVKDLVHRRLREIVTQTASAHGCTAEIDIETGHPATCCDPAAVARARACCHQLWGDRAPITELQPQMGGEDFSYYLQHKPGALIVLGVGNEACDAIHPHHSPQFRIDETVLHMGPALFAALALDGGG